MKRLVKILAFTGVVLLVMMIIGLSYVKLVLPDVGPPPEMKVDRSTERIERGKYLANHVAVCMDCHSTRDFNRFSGPMVTGSLGKGGGVFSQAEGFPGTFYARNITPANLESWSDGEIFRAITAGVSKDGHALFPVMPYQYYAQMDPQDIKDIIAYLRSIPALENQVPESKPSFPFNFMINTIPARPAFQQRPDASNELAYGAYLTNAAGCRECHSKVVNGKVVKETAFAGGRGFKAQMGTLYSANLTPDETGLGAWRKEDFIARFKTYTDSSAAPRLHMGDFQTIMPWTMYAGMKEEDLGAIFTYLKSLDPISNQVNRFELSQ